MIETWIQILVPLCLIIIMVAMGLELGMVDFRRVAAMPRAVAVGLLGQMLLLPALGFALALAPGWVPGLGGPLEPEVAVGIAVIVACPGSAPSNVFSYLARANTALSITLTAVSSLLTVITIPLWISLALALFYHDDAEIRIPLGQTVVQLFAVTVAPVGLGMTVRALRPELAERLKSTLRAVVPWLFAAVLLVLFVTQWSFFARDIPIAGPLALLLVCVALATAFGASQLAGLKSQDAFTISIEVGLQNGALASMIIINLLQRPELLAFPSVYALLSVVPVTAWTFWYRARRAPAEGLA